MNLHVGKQQGPWDFYEALVNYVSNLMQQNRNFMLHDSLKFNIYSLNDCTCCTLSKGSTEESTMYKAVIFLWKFNVSLQFLLRHCAYCRYSFESLGISCPCIMNKKIKESVYLVSWVLLQAYLLLVIYTDWVVCGNGRKLLTSFLKNEKLNPEICASKLHLTDQYRYTLAAVTNYYRKDARGHYSTTLLSNWIVTFDNKNATTKSNLILRSKTFKESTHLLLYTKEEILLVKGKINNLPKPWLISSNEKSWIEQQWLGDIPVEVSNIDANDLRTLCKKEWVNGDNRYIVSAKNPCCNFRWNSFIFHHIHHLSSSEWQRKLNMLYQAISLRRILYWFLCITSTYLEKVNIGQSMVGLFYRR